MAKDEALKIPPPTTEQVVWTLRQWFTVWDGHHGRIGLDIDYPTLNQAADEIEQLQAEVRRLRPLAAAAHPLSVAQAKELTALRARDEAAKAVEQAAENACAVIERVLDADASEGTPIWEWADEEAEAGVREVLAVADQLSTALDALAREHEDKGCD